MTQTLFFFRSLLGNKIGIACNNDPRNMTVLDQIDFLEGNQLDFGIIYIIGISIPFLTSYFAFLIVRERSSQYKKILLISGVSVKMYWIMTILWDYATYVVYITVFMVSFLILRFEGFGSIEMAITFGFLLLFGFSGIAFVYILSYLFNEGYFAFITATVTNMLLGVFNFDLLIRLLKYHRVVKTVFIWIPQFAIVDAIHLIFKHGYIKELCHQKLKVYNNDAEYLCKREFICCGNNLHIYDNIHYIHFLFSSIIEYN